MKSISVISVNFNHNVVTEAFLESIFRTNTYQPIEIIVIDNGSKINPVPGWKTKYPGVKFIRSDVNLGFAGGNNVGIAEAKGDYLFLVNNDTEFIEGLIDKLVETLDNDPHAGMVCPKIRYFDKPEMLQYAGFSKMNYYTARTKCIGQFETDKGQYDTLTETSFPHGAAMMVKREALEKAGMMAENYFLYYEEMDWCEKIRKAGYSIRLNMHALIYHKESVSVGLNSPLKEYFMNRNRILFIRRNCSLTVRTVFCIYFILLVTPRNIVSYIKNRQWGFIRVLLRAIAWNITNSINSKNLGYKINK
jgi:GT2 family glycosyltransferase